MGTPAFCICENKGADQLRGNRETDQPLCFATRIAQSLYFINPKFHASSHLLWLYSPVCVGPGQKPRKPVFSQRGSYGVLLTLARSHDHYYLLLYSVVSIVIKYMHDQNI